ncbi:La-related protein 6 Acheron [Larimichthys crocea]|uniref:La-related protein 6 Acheron n=1 Tax=Larimichthys crocea TaxID=215358 RepID=A0A6G0IGH5_LARCR|nr:La-related protein 6 Acheron [Larimichthys crocea]
MSNPIGNDAQSVQDEEDREGELLCLKIKAQLEDLFSSSHLAEDGFLLKHVQKNKQGYVSLKLLTCLKKIKVLTTDWYMTLAGAAYSEILEQVPPRLEHFLWSGGKTKEAPSTHHCTRGSSRSSAPTGNVTSLWILHPGEELPKELKCYAKRHNKLGQDLCAVVKFDKLEAVRKVYSALKAEEEKSNVKVPNESPDTYQPRESLDNSIQRTSEQISTSCYGQSFFGLHQRYSRTGWSSVVSDKDDARIPWVLRRKFAASALNPKVSGHPYAPCSMQRVLRQPFGPDGTKGFQGRRKPL